MNQRNNVYIGRYNPRKLFPLVDNKPKTKLLAHKAQLNVPDLIGVIRHQYDVKNISQLIESHNGFVIKPAKGSGGKGILVIQRHKNGQFFKSNGFEESLESIKRHISNILFHLYSR